MYFFFPIKCVNVYNENNVCEESQSYKNAMTAFHWKDERRNYHPGKKKEK